MEVSKSTETIIDVDRKISSSLTELSSLDAKSWLTDSAIVNTHVKIVVYDLDRIDSTSNTHPVKMDISIDQSCENVSRVTSEDIADRYVSETCDESITEHQDIHEQKDYDGNISGTFIADIFMMLVVAFVFLMGFKIISKK